MTENITEKLVDDLYKLTYTDFSDTVIHQAKRCLLDYLGVTFAGARIIREKGTTLFKYIEESHGESTIIGFHKKVNIENAVLFNGICSHITELDDGVRFGMLHPGTAIFSALLPIAEKESVNGRNFISGIISGYESAVRIACAVQPSHYNCGYHPTSTCGTIGAAIGIAAELGFSKTEMKDTLSTATISSSGSLKVIEDGCELKPFNSGRAALIGLLSANMGRIGFKGPDDALSGNNGFLSMMAKQYDVKMLEKQDTDSYAIEKVYVKPYASCRHAHPAIEAVLKLKIRNDLDTNTIKDIKVITYQGVLGKHDFTNICGVSSAKMSIPYSVAVALVYGKVGLDEFSIECVNNPIIQSLTKKVVVLSDKEITALVPQKRAAIVQIITDDGVCHTERVDYPKGEPENPLSDDELENKFISLATYGNKSMEACQEIIKIVWNLEEKLDNIFQLL